MSVPPTRVVVIGGGLAGLAAGLACADAGARVTVLERRPRLGGATWSFSRNGAWFDNGQHVFLRCCTSYRAFLERLGVADRVVLQPRLSVPVVSPSGRVAWLRRGHGPAPVHLARSLARFCHLSRGDRVRVARAAWALRRLDLDDPALDSLTFGEWLARQHQSDDAVASFWDLVALPTLNVEAAEASLSLAAMVFKTGLLTRADAADLGWSRVPLGQLHGDAAARALERAGASVLTATAVGGIEVVDGVVTGVRAESAHFDADAVILAVGHDAAADLLPRDAVADPERLHELGTSPIVNVHLVFDRKVINHPVAAAVDSPVQWVFDRTDSSGIDSGQCIAISLSAADEDLARPSPELVQRYSAELARLFPAVRSARLVDSIVTRERAATFRGRPGTRCLRPGPQTAVGGLYLAGAWTDTGWPATMEGAVRSGHAAAAAAVATNSTDGSTTSAAGRVPRPRRLDAEVVA